MKLHSISMLKHPREIVWSTLRDRLPEIVPLLDDVESVTVQSREEEPDGSVRLVNLWKAKPKLPALVASHLNLEMFAWTDRAEYRAGRFECAWRLEPHFFANRIQCSGVTRYEPAMGGRGTRITFEGELEFSTRNLPGVPAVFEGAVSSGIESFVAVLIPKNFRKLTEAVGEFLVRNPA